MFAAVLAVLALTACSPEQAIQAAFGRHGQAVVEEAKDVAWCESRWDNTAVSGPNVSMFQLNIRFHGHRPGMDRWRDDPLWSAIAAENLYAEQGWGPWSCRPR